MSFTNPDSTTFPNPHSNPNPNANPNADTNLHYMVERCVRRTVNAAESGWLPDDISHVLGPKVLPILSLAAPRVPVAVDNAVIRQAWLLVPARTATNLSASQLRSLESQLWALPRLQDAPALSTRHTLSNASTLTNSSPATTTTSATNSPDHAKIRRKIQALLAKAESTEFEDEADALIAKAQTLRQRHRISEVLEDQDATIFARRVHITGPWVKHQFTLLGAITRANGGASLLLDERGLATIFATDADIDHIIDLYESLNRQCDWFMCNGEGAEFARKMRETSSYRRSFRLAYAARIAELLACANSQSATATDGGSDGGSSNEPHETSHTSADVNKALPVLANRQEEAEASRNRLFPHLSSMKLSITNYRGVDDGVDAANRSHLSGDGAGISMGRKQLSA